MNQQPTRTGRPARLVREVSKSGLRQVGRVTAFRRPSPDFLIIGTKRGGTTSLWNWLLQHPHMMPMFPARQHLKSPHYFYWHYRRGMRWYLGHFPTREARRLAERRLSGPVVTGEASPNYLSDPRVPARVARDLPDVRVVVLLRDPVDRAASHHRERTNAGVEPLDLTAALAAEPGRLAGELERMAAEPYYYSRAHDWYSYRSRGVYAPQVRRWKDALPAERLLFVQSERLYETPTETYQEITDFLGLPRHALVDPPRFNYRPRPEMPEATRADLTAYYAPHNEELFALLGERYDWARPDGG